MSQEAVFELLDGETMTLGSAQACPDNILHELDYPRLQSEFRQSIEAQRSNIEAFIRDLLGCKAAYMWGQEQWKCGSFNLAIPIEVAEGSVVFLRLPFPYRCLTTADLEERLRTEIATYVWMHERCPDVPIPQLYAFGFANGQFYTCPENSPWILRLLWSLTRLSKVVLGRSCVTRHVRQRYRHPLPTGFMLLSEAQGKSLMRRWSSWNNGGFRRKVCRGLIRAQMSMNRDTFERIGSLHLDADGSVTLTNRPLHLHMSIMESQGVPGLPSRCTYGTLQDYYSHLFAWHDQRLVHQPNAIQEYDEGREQLAVLSGLRSLMHHYTRLCVDKDKDPIHLFLTDLRPANIFVDEGGNITGVIDLEFACSRPASTYLPPYWLTSLSLDQLAETSSEDRLAYIEEFLDVFKEEEETQTGCLFYAPLARRAWDSGAFWFHQAVMAPNMTELLFKHRIRPHWGSQVTEPIFHQVLSHLWCKDPDTFIRQKLSSTEAYKRRLADILQKDISLSSS